MGHLSTSLGGAILSACLERVHCSDPHNDRDKRSEPRETSDTAALHHVYIPATSIQNIQPIVGTQHRSYVESAQQGRQRSVEISDVRRLVAAKSYRGNDERKDKKVP